MPFSRWFQVIQPQAVRPITCSGVRPSCRTEWDGLRFSEGTGPIPSVWPLRRDNAVAMLGKHRWRTTIPRNNTNPERQFRRPRVTKGCGRGSAGRWLPGRSQPQLARRGRYVPSARGPSGRHFLLASLSVTRALGGRSSGTFHFQLPPPSLTGADWSVTCV